MSSSARGFAVVVLASHRTCGGLLSTHDPAEHTHHADGDPDANGQPHGSTNCSSEIRSSNPFPCGADNRSHGHSVIALDVNEQVILIVMEADAETDYEAFLNEAMTVVESMEIEPSD